MVDEVDYIQEKSFGELVPEVFLDHTRDGLVEIIARMRDRDAIGGLILGGTELALILGEPVLRSNVTSPAQRKRRAALETRRARDERLAGRRET